VQIAAGTFKQLPSDWESPGSGEVYRGNMPELWVDSHEVTERAYATCVHAGKCPQRSVRGEAGLPQTDVSLHDASAFCRFAGGRLPSSREFSYIAGSNGRRYPWGNTGLVCRRAAFGLATGPCRSGGNGPQVVGAHPAGRTRQGVYDLAGNVAEWTASGRVHGGSWRSRDSAQLRTRSYYALSPEKRRDDIGFRCVYARSRSKP